jgi:dipeptidyl aminopeptidase/acylaminoacyl peptidase
LIVHLASLDSNEVKRLVPANSGAIYSRPGFLLFARGTTLMAQPFDTARLATTGEAVPVLDEAPVFFLGRLFASVSDNGTLLHGVATSTQAELQWVDRHGTLVDVVAGPAQYRTVALSPDGTQVAFDRLAEGNWDVWLMDLQRRITSRFTSAPGLDNVPVWSADGRTVAFATSTAAFTAGGDGVLDIGQRPSNLSGPAELLLKVGAPPILYPSDWSSDGRFLAYYRSDPKTHLDLWVLPLFGERKPIPLLQSEFNESQGQFSPDGKWIAYVSDESGAPQVYVQSFPTLTGKWQVSRDGGSQPRWRRDGKELFYLAADRKLMAVSVKTGGAFEANVPQVLFGTALSFAELKQTYSVSPDGQRFLLHTPASDSPTSLTVTLNWQEELKARVPTK